MKYIYEVGDIVQLKKKHPCGSTEWQILRVGADFKLKCTGCGHEIMVSRTMVEKNTKNFHSKTSLKSDSRTGFSAAKNGRNTTTVLYEGFVG